MMRLAWLVGVQIVSWLALHVKQFSAVLSSFLRVVAALVVSSSLSSWSASACGLPARTVAAYLSVPTSAALSTSQYLSAALYISVVSRVA